MSDRNWLSTSEEVSTMIVPCLDQDTSLFSGNSVRAGTAFRPPARREFQSASFGCHARSSRYCCSMVRSADQDREGR